MEGALSGLTGRTASPGQSYMGAQKDHPNIRISHIIMILLAQSEGEPEIIVCSILMFVWSSGALYMRDSHITFQKCPNLLLVAIQSLCVQFLRGSSYRTLLELS